MKDKICLKLINFPFSYQKVEKYSQGLGAGGSVLSGLKSIKHVVCLGTSEIKNTKQD